MSRTAQHPAPPHHQDQQRRQWDGLLIVTEIALLLVTASAVVSLNRLFLDDSFRPPLLLQAVAAHLVVAGLRRANLGILSAWLVTMVAGAIVIAWAQYPDTLWTLLPSQQTWHVAYTDVQSANRLFQEVSAPAPVEPGFIVVGSMAVWVITFIADWAAFRAHLAFEALLPGTTAVLFAAVLGYEGPLGPGAAIFAATSLFFVLVHRTWRKERSTSWALLQRRRSRRTLMISGGTLASLAVLVGAASAPQVPGADDPPVIPWRDVDEGDDTRVVVSPLVDIQSQLLDQPNLEVFTVRTDDPTGAYWRLTALDVFDGQMFKASYQTDEASAGDELPAAVPDSQASIRQVSQEITINALGNIWLPAAYEPAAITEGDAPITYDESSGTLMVDKSLPDSDNLSYTVVSEVAVPTTEELRQAAPEVPSEIADRHLQLPDDFSERVVQEAQQITEGATSRYDQAMALMQHLRSFEYDQEAQIGQSEDALEEFLFDVQAGYCQQFSTAFAVMARSLGIPTRVAVGFTKGTQDPNEPTLFRVTGKHAHAWPEVYFQEYGWIPFDPTPGRAPPTADNWLDIPEQQAQADGDGTVSTTVPNRSDSGPNQTQPSEEARPSPERPGREESQTSPPGASPPVEEAEQETWLDRVLVWATRSLKVGTVAAAVYVLLVPGGILLRRALRRRQARQPTQQIRLWWNELLEHAALAGLTFPHTLTLREQAAELRTQMSPAGSSALGSLVPLVERSMYSGTTPTEGEALGVKAATDKVRAELDEQQPPHRRLLSYLDARRLFSKSDSGGDRRSAHSARRTT